MPDLSRLTPVALRDVWPDEAGDFTPWLLENAEVLADVLGIELDLTAAEHPVGKFSLDLFGNDHTNQCPLIVENQLEKTDHSHLGQLLTYAAGTDALTVVWLAASFQEEHRQALDYLNDLAGEEARFFGVEIGAVRIGDSPPAPLFKVVAQPNDWHAQASAAAKSSGTGGSGEAYREYWTAFLQRLQEVAPGWCKWKKAPTTNWFTMTTQVRGVSYSASFAMGQRMRVELYLDTGDSDGTAELYEALAARREKLEQGFGGPLDWEPLPNRRASRIAVYSSGSIKTPEEHDKYREWMVAALLRMRKAFEAVSDGLSG
jgi:hypothetical protein